MLKNKPVSAVSKFVVPLILGSILQSMYSMADTAIVGKFIGDDALAAVGATGLTFTVIVSVVQAFMTGFAVTAGQKVGANDYDGLKRIYVNGFMLSVCASVIAAVLGIVFNNQLMSLLNTPLELREQGGAYIRVIYMGLPTTMLYNFFGEMLRATGNSKKPFMYLVIASAINIILDLFFICVLKTGVWGAGLATVISQAVSAVLCYINLTRSSMYFRFNKKDIYFEKDVISAVAKVGLPASFLNIVILSGVFVLQRFTNGFGTELIAANSAAARVVGIFVIPIYSYGSGISVFVAQNFGAGQYDRIKQGVRSILGLLWVYSVLILIISQIITPFIIKYIISDTPVVVEWGNKVVTSNIMGYFGLSYLIVTKSTLNALSRPFMGTIQGVADVLIRISVVIIGTKYFGFWGIAFGDSATWMIGAVIFIFMLMIENRKINKKYGFKII